MAALGCARTPPPARSGCAGPTAPACSTSRPSFAPACASIAPSYVCFEDASKGLDSPLKATRGATTRRRCRARRSRSARARAGARVARARRGPRARRELAAALAERLAAARPHRRRRAATRRSSPGRTTTRATRDRLAAAGVVVRNLPGTPLLRASVGAWNDESDLERLLAALRRSLRRVCVYAGSNPGRDPAYAESAPELGALLARRGIGLVYGGGKAGLMGALADAALAEGGEVVGVMPQALIDREIGHQGLTELRIVGSMHERKAMMAELAGRVRRVSGGAGTLEELIEVSPGCSSASIASRWRPERQRLLRRPRRAVRPRGAGGFLRHAHRAALHSRPTRRRCSRASRAGSRRRSRSGSNPGSGSCVPPVSVSASQCLRSPRSAPRAPLPALAADQTVHVRN